MIQLENLVKQYKRIYNDDIQPHLWDEKQANTVLEWCSKAKERILLESHYNSYMNNKTYARIYLLETMARIVLREIAPKRIRSKRVKKYGK